MTEATLFFDWAGAFETGTGKAGSKGWNLGRLARYGFDVPAGGVLSTEAYKDFIGENRLQRSLDSIAEQVTAGNIGEAETERRLAAAREAIQSGTIPSHILAEIESGLIRVGLSGKLLSVRSSALAEDTDKTSFAGIHESFLNISGLQNILYAVKGCYASLWTAQAVAYRRKMHIPDNEVFMAVVMMEMVHAHSAGVAFSCDPRTGREDVLTVGANFGLGESVVRGGVDPDEYILSSVSSAIVHTRVGSKELVTLACPEGGIRTAVSEFPGERVLSDDQIGRLGNLVRRVFETLGGGEVHQDVEWVFDGKDFALVQARPVTALPQIAFGELKDQCDVWSNANFRDAVPMVLSTLNRTAMKKNINALMNAPFQIIGYPMPEGVQFVKIHKGRAYANISLLQWCNYDSMGVLPRDTNTNFGGHQSEIPIREKNPYGGLSGLKRLRRLMKFFRAVSRYKKKADLHFEKVNDFSSSFLKKELRVVDDRDLIGLFKNIEAAANEFSPVYMMLTGAAASLSMLIKVLDGSLPGKGTALSNALMAGAGNITSALQGYRLLQLAEMVRDDPAARAFFSADSNGCRWDEDLPDSSRVKQDFRAFLDEFGHRAVYELEIANPRWNEDPSYLFDTVRRMIGNADVAALRRQQREKTEAAWKIINAELPYLRRFLVRYLVRQSSQGMELREMAKSVFARLLAPLRMIALEAGRRFEKKAILADPNDIFHCAWVEVFSILEGDWDGSGLGIIVEDRKALFKEMEALSPPDIIIDDIPQRSFHETQSGTDFLQGIAVAAGRASGPARLIHHPNQGLDLRQGDVLVAPSTDPGWTPLFLRASAIVMETGGYFSHGSIVAREYGIPAVVNIPGIMETVDQGQEVVVDGDEGRIFLKEINN